MPAATAAAAPLDEPPGRTCWIVRAGRDARREQGELGGHGLADYQSASPAGEGDAGSIVGGLASGVDWRATFGGQVEGVDHVLHPPASSRGAAHRAAHGLPVGVPRLGAGAPRPVPRTPAPPALSGSRRARSPIHHCRPIAPRSHSGHRFRTGYGRSKG